MNMGEKTPGNVHLQAHMAKGWLSCVPGQAHPHLPPQLCHHGYMTPTICFSHSLSDHTLPSRLSTQRDCCDFCAYLSQHLSQDHCLVKDYLVLLSHYLLLMVSKRLVSNSINVKSSSMDHHSHCGNNHMGHVLYTFYIYKMPLRSNSQSVPTPV